MKNTDSNICSKCFWRVLCIFPCFDFTFESETSQQRREMGNLQVSIHSPEKDET